jgi:hypothetical protein
MCLGLDRGYHLGQRSSSRIQKAGHMIAIDPPVKILIFLLHPRGRPHMHQRRGLTQLSVWLLKLDVWPDRIQPVRPDQNGRHERMHRVLHEDTANPPAATLAAQRIRMDEWQVVYNT